MCVNAAFVHDATYEFVSDESVSPVSSAQLLGICV